MAFIEINNVCFTYPEQESQALTDIQIDIHVGDFILLCGSTGCGKTTLLKQLKKQICPAGEQLGSIMYDGVNLKDLDEKRAVCEIGMVFQDPESQIVMDTVWHELAFSLENLALSRDEMRKRIAEMVSFFGLENILNQSVQELSGGQKQIVNLASVLILRPKVLLLDEPISQLDPIAAKEFLQMLCRINEELAITIIISEHRLDDLVAIANRIIVMESGRLKYDGEIQKVCREIEKDSKLHEYLPSFVRLFLESGGEGNLPLTIKQAVAWAKTKEFMTRTQKSSIIRQNKLLSYRNVYFRYGRNEKDVLKNLSFEVLSGEFLAILGGNGAGKSTLLKLMMHVISPQRGVCLLNNKKYKQYNQAEINKTMGYLAQNPRFYFTHDTVLEEIEPCAQGLGITEAQVHQSVEDYDLGKVLNHHPSDLSGGQQQKLAILMVLLANPKVLLLDEPTKGLDPVSKLKFQRKLEEINKAGTTVVMVTHDLEFAASTATRCAMLFDGEITSSLPPRTFFSENYFYTTTVNRVLRDCIPDAVSIEDVCLCKKV